MIPYVPLNKRKLKPFLVSKGMFNDTANKGDETTVLLLKEREMKQAQPNLQNRVLR